jgi:hypothetical protein
MALGWGSFFGGIGKIIDKLPIQGREERWKNQLDNLKKEKKNLLDHPADPKKANRLIEVNEKLEYLTQLLKNKD